VVRRYYQYSASLIALRHVFPNQLDQLQSSCNIALGCFLSLPFVNLNFVVLLCVTSKPFSVNCDKILLGYFYDLLLMQANTFR